MSNKLIHRKRRQIFHHLQPAKQSVNLSITVCPLTSSACCQGRPPTPYSISPLPHSEQNSLWSKDPEPLSASWTLTYSDPFVTFHASLAIFVVIPNGPPVNFYRSQHPTSVSWGVWKVVMGLPCSWSSGRDWSEHLCLDHLTISHSELWYNSSLQGISGSSWLIQWKEVCLDTLAQCWIPWTINEASFIQ